MLNNSGITKTSYASQKQILANVSLQNSVGCIVPQSLGVVVGARTIVKAGTPLNMDLSNINVVVKKPVAAIADPATPAVPMNAVLLHDVDVTAGNGNGTALIFGFVNLNRVDATVATTIATARTFEGTSQLLTFVKM